MVLVHKVVFKSILQFRWCPRGKATRYTDIMVFLPCDDNEDALWPEYVILGHPAPNTRFWFALRQAIINDHGGYGDSPLGLRLRNVRIEYVWQHPDPTGHYAFVRVVNGSFDEPDLNSEYEVQRNLLERCTWVSVPRNIK